MLGAHFSVANGLENALYSAGLHGCNTLQIFTKNSRTWKEKVLSENEVDAFKTAKKKIRPHCVISHASYLINIASNDTEKLKKSINALACELKRSSILNIEYVVLHPGSHLGAGEKKGIQTAIETLKTVFSTDFSTQLLIETTAGMGSHLGQTFEQLSQIMELAGLGSKIGVCMDTSHVFAAGYDIRTMDAYQATMNTFDRIIGLENLRVIHLNDSKTGLGSKKDRHDHIGKGHIGLKAFELIMNDKRLSQIPKIIETPKMTDDMPMDPVNLKTLLDLTH